MQKTKRKDKKKTKRNKSFIQEYKWWIIIPVGFVVVAYVLIYVFFRGSGFLPSGKGLEKKDWLSFLSEYLGFAGTLIISLVAILQSKYFAEQDRKRISAERMRKVQPILSVNIVSMDSSISNTAEIFSVSRPESIPHHKNVTIEIENAGKYPIRNVIVFDKYFVQMLKPNEKKQIQVAYSDSPDAKMSKNITVILETDYERTDSGIPKSFPINYDDADGNEFFQIFELKNFDGELFYSLEGTYNA